MLMDTEDPWALTELAETRELGGGRGVLPSIPWPLGALVCDRTITGCIGLITHAIADSLTCDVHPIFYSPLISACALCAFLYTCTCSNPTHLLSNTCKTSSTYDTVLDGLFVNNQIHVYAGLLLS